ncbi:MAG: SH3 domain-containing protein [Clostridiaceae bacterium]|nr:SH3 domain-containing protein [Clostridiaceae bacterium]
MKKRILTAFLVVFLVFSVFTFITSGTEDVKTFERVDFISGVVIANELNLRNGPSMQNDIIGTFKKHKWVNVLAEIGDWYAVFDPDTGMVGCVAKRYLTNAENIAKAPQTPVATPTPGITTPAPGKDTMPTPEQPTTDLSENEKLLLELINQERAKSNLPPLQADPELMKVARIKAKDMSDNNYFSHYSPTYGSPFDMMRQFGINFKAAAENIAGNSTVQGAVNSWMKSQGHRANIMNSSYNYTGIGIAESNKYGYVFVQMFIRK